MYEDSLACLVRLVNDIVCFKRTILKATPAIDFLISFCTLTSLSEIAVGEDSKPLCRLQQQYNLEVNMHKRSYHAR